MAYPQHPETIIIKNPYYPNGLREIDAWDYYQSIKSDLLKQVKGRDLIFWIAVSENKFIVLRKGKTTRFMRLTSSNYDNNITGRTISIHSVMRRLEDIAIIDIDFHDFSRAKIAAKDTFEFVSKSIPIVKSASIRFTGKESFHIFCNLNRKYNIDAIRMVLRKTLQQSPLSGKYTIESKRTPTTPNLDLAPNKFRGGFITLHSLSEIGLKCMEVPYSKLASFDPRIARIK